MFFEVGLLRRETLVLLFSQNLLEKKWKPAAGLSDAVVSRFSVGGDNIRFSNPQMLIKMWEALRGLCKLVLEIGFALIIFFVTP